MSAARRKKTQQSLYDSFYGKWSDEIDKAMKTVEEQVQDYAQRIEAILESNRKKKSEAPTSHTMTYKNDLDKLRESIRKGAKKDTLRDKIEELTKTSIHDQVKQARQQRTTNTPVIDNVVRVKDIPQFTNQTHRVEVSLGSADYYSEQITTKIVGMEQTEWWEYVLIYGFFKSFKIAHEYTLVKEYMDKGIQSSRTVSGQKLFIKFIPKKKDDVNQVKDVVNGQLVIRETGTACAGATLALEVPQIPIVKTEEYRKGYFVYEDTFSTLVIDIDALRAAIENMLQDCGVNSGLIEEIKKQVNDGRLSAI